jgi:hypothetical protein
MGYSIEVSFNILKNSSVTEIKNMIINGAEECGCDSFQEDYEYDAHTQFKRSHCVITLNFSKTEITDLIRFLRFIKSRCGIHLETIYDENEHYILYASQYYVTQKMDKCHGKTYNKEKRERSYSDDENMILQSIKK